MNPLGDYDTLAGHLAPLSTTVASGRPTQRPFYTDGLSSLTLVYYAIALPPTLIIVLVPCAPAKGLRLCSDDTLSACDFKCSLLPEGQGNTLFSTNAGRNFCVFEKVGLVTHNLQLHKLSLA